MPHSPLSLKLTSAYRQRLDVTRTSLQRLAVDRWPTIEGFDSSDWPERMAAAVTQAQIQAVRASAGYLSAFLTLETGKRSKGPAIDSKGYAGKSFDGAPLALLSPFIGVRAKLKEGASSEEALRYGLDRAKRQVGIDFDHAHRTALLDAIHADDRFGGWQRATSGTCGACLGAAGEVQHALRFPVHPGCACVSEPVVKGVSNAFPRPTGAELFAAKSKSEKEEAVGPLAAALLEEGRIKLHQLVEHESLDSDAPGFITQRPVDQLVSAK